MRLLIFFLCLSANAFSADYFWVNGTGRWSEFANHWATSSGGTNFHIAPPDTMDNVFFDVNSFSSHNDTMYFDMFVNRCKDFTLSGLGFNATIADDPALFQVQSYGSVSISGMVNWQSQIEFALYGHPHNTIDIDGVHLTNTLIINAWGIGQYHLAADLSCYVFDVFDGSLITHDFAVTTTQNFRINTEKLVALGQSNITAGQTIEMWAGLGGPIQPYLSCDSAFFNTIYFSIDPVVDSLHFRAINADLVWAYFCTIDTLNAWSFDGNGTTVHYFNGEYLIAGGSFLFPDPNYFGTIIVDSALYLAGVNHIDFLTINNPGPQFFIGDTCYIHGSLTFNTNPSVFGVIKPGNFTGVLHVDTGILCIDYISLFNVEAAGGAQFFAGHSSIDQGGNTNWIFTGCATGSGVWPGDANFDLQVDNLDILAIAVAFGENGPFRTNASLAWIEQPAADWNFLNSGINMKHTDCDGNGIINYDDTLAVNQNFGLSHPARLNRPPDLQLATGSLTVNIVNDTSGISPVIVNVSLGDLSNPVDTMYGIVFDLAYDPNVFQFDQNSVDFTNCWLGTNGVDLITNVVHSPGLIQFALSSTAQADLLNGYGHLLTFSMTPYASTPPSIAHIVPAGVATMQFNEKYETLLSSGDSVLIDSSVVTMIPEVGEKMFSIYPNPAKDIIRLFSNTKISGSAVVTDACGKVVLQKHVDLEDGESVNLNINTLSKGIYFLRIQSAGELVQERFVVGR